MYFCNTVFCVEKENLQQLLKFISILLKINKKHNLKSGRIPESSKTPRRVMNLAMVIAHLVLRVGL